MMAGRVTLALVALLSLQLASAQIDGAGAFANVNCSAACAPSRSNKMSTWGSSTDKVTICGCLDGTEKNFYRGQSISSATGAVIIAFSMGSPSCTNYNLSDPRAAQVDATTCPANSIKLGSTCPEGCRTMYSWVGKDCFVNAVLKAADPAFSDSTASKIYDECISGKPLNSAAGASFKAALFVLLAAMFVLL